MVLADLYALIRSETGRDTSGSIDNTTHLNPWLEIEYHKVRRMLVAAFPELFLVTSPTTILTSTQLVPKLANFGGLERVERLEGSTWVSVPQGEQFQPELTPYLSWREEGAFYVIQPAASAPGSYRLVYKSSPPCFPASDIPAGFIDVVVQRVIAKVQRRTGGDDAPHLKEADATWKSMVRALKAARRGSSPEPGFVSVYGD